MRVIVSDLISRLDFRYVSKLRTLIQNSHTPCMIVQIYPFTGGAMAKAATKPLQKTAIYEQNIEWEFYRDKIGLGLMARFLTRVIKSIELDSLKKSDYVICATQADCEGLIKNGIDYSKMRIWLPPRHPQDSYLASPIPLDLQEKIEGKFVVGFVGSNFEPNLIAVKHIFRIASNVRRDVIFLVMGSISDRFENRGADIPQNVIFTGYVEKLDSYLGSCSAFINPKTVSDTGVETKMFDYMKFDRTIVTTEIGGRGFENFGKVVISRIEEIPRVINELSLDASLKGVKG